MLFGSTGKPEQQHDDHVSAEDQSFIMEAAILESASPEELEGFLGNHDEVQAAIHEEIVQEKTIVRLDKAAKLSQAQKVAVFTVAKEKNDPKFKKLVTVWRLERFLENELMKKYGNEGMRRARKTVANGSKSKSALVSKVARNMNKQLNGGAKR